MRWALLWLWKPKTVRLFIDPIDRSTVRLKTYSL
jgi:hypothetical protein